MTVEESGAFVKSRNIVIGNPDNAKILFTAHYDTCARMPVPNFITPKNIPVYLLYQLLLTLLLLIPPFVLSILAAILFHSLPEIAGLLLTEITMLGTFAVEIWLLLAGFANPQTANDNTSGVVTVLTLADRLAAREDVAFVLFDNEELGLLGSAAFAKAHREVKNNTLLVNFDCVSDGDHLMFVFSKAAQQTELHRVMKERAEKICASYGKTAVMTSTRTTFYPSDQVYFKKSIAVAALKKASLIGLYMDRIHTKRDTVFMTENLKTLLALFENTTINDI